MPVHPAEPVTHSSVSRHNNPRSDSSQKHQESQQTRHYSLTGATVNEERRRLAERLAWIAAGVQTRRRLAERLAWLAAEWRCCELRVIVAMVFIPLRPEIKTQSRDHNVASASNPARLAIRSFLRPGFVPPTQSMYVPFLVNQFRSSILLIGQYKCLKSCCGDFYSRKSDAPHNIKLFFGIQVP